MPCAILTVASGGNYLDAAFVGKVFAAVKQNNLRESETLCLIALGFSNKEIAEEFNISVKTIEAHKTNVLKKLNMTSRKDIVRYAVLQRVDAEKLGALYDYFRYENFVLHSSLR